MTGIDNIIISYFNLWKENQDIDNRALIGADLKDAIIAEYTAQVVNVEQIKALDTLQLSLDTDSPDGQEDEQIKEQNEAQMAEYEPMLLKLFEEIEMRAISYNIEGLGTMYMKTIGGGTAITIDEEP